MIATFSEEQLKQGFYVFKVKVNGEWHAATDLFIGNIGLAQWKEMYLGEIIGTVEERDGMLLNPYKKQFK